MRITSEMMSKKPKGSFHELFKEIERKKYPAKRSAPLPTTEEERKDMQTEKEAENGGYKNTNC